MFYILYMCMCTLDMIHGIRCIYHSVQFTWNELINQMFFYELFMQKCVMLMSHEAYYFLFTLQTFNQLHDDDCFHCFSLSCLTSYCLYSCFCWSPYFVHITIVLSPFCLKGCYFHFFLPVLFQLLLIYFVVSFLILLNFNFFLWFVSLFKLPLFHYFVSCFLLFVVSLFTFSVVYSLCCIMIQQTINKWKFSLWFSFSLLSLFCCFFSSFCLKCFFYSLFYVSSPCFV